MGFNSIPSTEIEPNPRVILLFFQKIEISKSFQVTPLRSWLRPSPPKKKILKRTELLPKSPKCCF